MNSTAHTTTDQHPSPAGNSSFPTTMIEFLAELGRAQELTWERLGRSHDGARPTGEGAARRCGQPSF